MDSGGFELAANGALQSLFAAAASEAAVRFLYLSINSGNEYYPLLRGGRYGQPLIIKPIGGYDLKAGPLNFFGGMRDTY